ncbi:MAG: hypothetical protein PVG74_23610 [Desulfobacterales bacterium]
MKKFLIFLLIALIQFGLSVLVIPLTMSVAKTLNVMQSMPTFLLQTLVTATRILHFPIISLSWYPRQWFPGEWIRIPMLINSFLWAAGILLLAVVGKKILRKSP